MAVPTFATADALAVGRSRRAEPAPGRLVDDVTGHPFASLVPAAV
jgi:hypothetical protein